MNELKYEFNTMEELQEALKHLEDYHTCELSTGKIVCIGRDKLGNDLCMYCHQIVKYPKLKKEAFEKWAKGLK